MTLHIVTASLHTIKNNFTIEDALKDSFLRQRRNLFITNGIILFAFYTKVNISQFTFAGITFSGFGNPQVIYLFLWIIFSYFLYRFILFFLEGELTSLTTTWKRIMNSIANKKLEELARKNSPNFIQESMTGYYNVKMSSWTLKFQSKVYNDSPYGAELENKKLKITYLDLLPAQLYTLLKFSFLTSSITNYLLPILLSVYVIIIVGFSSWEGSFIKLLP